VSTPYLGQIEAFPFNFVPKNWLPCSGQILPINQYQALFSLLGTTYGGNGTQTFALPNLQGRVAMGQGNGSGLTPRVIGETVGEANHTILLTETPTHNHGLVTAPAGVTTNNTDVPSATVVLGSATGLQGTGSIPVNPYAATPPAPSVTMAGGAVGLNPGGQPHSNMMPYLALQFCIAMSGEYPSRN
jgi:microcystin-dependent protein